MHGDTQEKATSTEHSPPVYLLQLSLLLKLKVWLSNSVVTGEPSYLDLRCLQMYLIFACGTQRVDGFDNTGSS